jgi:hypothetical protein
MMHPSTKIARILIFLAGGALATLTACEGPVETCSAPFELETEPSTLESPDQYIASSSRPTDNGLFLVELVNITPTPKYTDDYTWKLLVQDGTCSLTESVTVMAEPRMPAHDHGTTPEFTEAVLDDAGSYVLPDLHLFMAGVWSIELTITGADGETDTVSYFFDLKG